MLRRLRAILDAIAARLHGFRVVQFSIQRDHLHLVVEAKDRDSLRSGIARLAIRFALAMNRILGRTKGKVWGDRYHRRDLATPREVRNALGYVLSNHRKHEGRYARLVDHFSTAASFDGWKMPDGTPAYFFDTEPWRPPRSRTWLLRQGWRRHGLLEPMAQTPQRRSPTA